MTVVAMNAEYLLIDLATDLVWGPYPTLSEARSRAEDFENWEILNNENVVDWTTALRKQRSGGGQSRNSKSGE